MEAIAREEVMKRFMEARNKKRECVSRIEKRMKDSYEKRTGKKANYTFVL